MKIDLSFPLPLIPSPAGRGDGLDGATIPSPLGERVRVRGHRKSIFVLKYLPGPAFLVPFSLFRIGY
jgi:hypothetical protein